MDIFTNLHKKRPSDEIPIAGEPPIGLAELEELMRTIRESGRTCDHTCKQIKEFLQGKDLEVESMLRWLHRSEIFCDCALPKAARFNPPQNEVPPHPALSLHVVNGDVSS